MNSGLHHLGTRMHYEWSRFFRSGVKRISGKILKRLLRAIIGVLLLPVSLALHVVGFRRLTVFTDRIGHLAVEPDCLLKECALDLIPKRRWFLLAPPSRIANIHLLSYWEPHIRMVRGRVACFLLESMSQWSLMRHNTNHYILEFDKTHTAYRINASWARRSPILRLTATDLKWADLALRDLGIPENSWFVCVHIRESGFSPEDEVLHAHRNGSITAVIPAIREIIRRGGWVVRIGDPTAQPLETMPKVIDYAHHPMKSERLDVILCARSRFILGNTSGIALVGSVFGVPCALANMIPLSTLGLLPGDLSIPKLLWSINENRLLRFDEIMASPLSTYRYAKLYSDANVRVDENTAEDILDLAAEMLDRLEGRFVEDNEYRQLHGRFMALFREGHYSFGASSRVSAAFLRKYRHLLPT